MEDMAFADRMEALEVPIPRDHPRGRCPAIVFAQESQWHNLDTWLLRARWEDVLQIGPDDVSPAKANLRASVARYKVPSGVECPIHAKATAAVVEMFAMYKLLELKSGKNRQTALCQVAAHGNYTVATLLLDAGASTPPLGYSKLRHSRLFFCGGVIVSVVLGAGRVRGVEGARFVERMGRGWPG